MTHSSALQSTASLVKPLATAAWCCACGLGFDTLCNYGLPSPCLQTRGRRLCNRPVGTVFPTRASHYMPRWSFHLEWTACATNFHSQTLHAFDDLHAAGVSIPAGITFVDFVDADKDPELCAKLTDDKIIRQVMEDSDDSDTVIEEAALTQPTSSELMQAVRLSSVYSNSMTFAEIEADTITGKWNAVPTKIGNYKTTWICTQSRHTQKQS